MTTETDINSRTGNRIDPSCGTALVHGLAPQPLSAQVTDESFGGIGVFLPIIVSPQDAQGLKGRELPIEYSGVQCTAVIRHVAAEAKGCRFGLEWKAQALSRCLRELLTLQEGVGKDLVQVLPGGLSMMWKMYEAGRWIVMLENTTRLQRQIAAHHLLDEPIERFKAALEEAVEMASTVSPKEKVEAALNALINDCIRVFG